MTNKIKQRKKTDEIVNDDRSNVESVAKVPDKENNRDVSNLLAEEKLLDKNAFDSQNIKNDLQNNGLGLALIGKKKHKVIYTKINYIVQNS